MRLGLADSSTAPKEQTTRQAYDLLSARTASAPGFTAPIPVVVDMRDDASRAAKLEAAHQEGARRRPGGRADLQHQGHTPNGVSVAIINAYSKYAPQDAKTDDIVSELRDTTIPTRSQGSSAQAYVSGQNAAFTDIGDRIFVQRAVVPAVHHRRHVPACWRWRSARS